MALSIGELVGYVDLDTSGVRRGAATTRAAMAGLDKSMTAGTGKVSAKWGMVRSAIAAVGTVGVAAVAKNVVDLEAQFSKSMAQISASTGASGAELDDMRALAMKLGADTSFSANEAADAMLELAKAGVSTSDIMGGTLAGTLQLAAAGGTDLGTAATIASNAMNTFGLKGSDMAQISAALAGGANASSASVESLGQALAQVGPGATNAGLSLQETVAALAAFDSAGIKGSDAGTSLKTMLANLQPATDSAASAMEKYGLMTDKGTSAFVKANGEFKSMAQISELLQTNLGSLSDAERQRALNTIFGSDASRAATVLMKNGAEGINKFVKATNDQTAAQKMADANTSGTAGALERMGGALETAGLAAGQLLAPAVVLMAEAVGKAADGLAKATTFLREHSTVAIVAGVAVGILAAAVGAHNAAMAVGAAGGLASWLKGTRLVSAVTKTWAAVQWALNLAMSMNPIGLVVIALALLIGAIVLIATKTTWFQTIWKKVWGAIKAVASAVAGWFTKTLPTFFSKAWDKVVSVTTTLVGGYIRFVTFIPRKIIGALSGIGGKIAGVFRGAWNGAVDITKNLGAQIIGFVTGIPGKMAALGSKFGQAGKDLLQLFIDGMKNAAGVIAGIAGNVWDAVRGLLNGAIDKINGALEFTIDLPGPKNLHVNLPDIPQIPGLATGGRATSSTLAVIGEGREPESVLPDSVLRGLLERVHASGAASAQAGGGRGAPLIGQVVQAPGESADLLAERLWFKTRTRG